jgi:hypothetical protein
MLSLGTAATEENATRALRSMKRLSAKNHGDLNETIVSAGYYARKWGETMFAYHGNSYGHVVWRVSCDAADYLCGINNTGAVVYSVSPTLEVVRHDVLRCPAGKETT